MMSDDNSPIGNQNVLVFVEMRVFKHLFVVYQHQAKLRASHDRLDVRFKIPGCPLQCFIAHAKFGNLASLFSINNVI